MDHFETIWIKKEKPDEVSTEPGPVRCKGSAMVNYETVWIKAEEADEVPNELESMVQVHPPNVNIKEELDKGGNEETCKGSAMVNYETVWIKEEGADEVANESESVTCKGSAMVNYETVWIKEEGADEVPNESESVFGDDPLGISCTREEPEVMWEVDGTKNIVATSIGPESDSTRDAGEVSSVQHGREVHHCTTCSLSFSSAAYRDRHHSYCWRRCKLPSKVSCATAINDVHGVLSKEGNSASYAGLRHCSTKSDASKIQDNTNPISCISLNPCSQAHSGKEDFKCNYLNKILAKQGNDWGTNVDRLQPTQDDTDISSGLTAYGVKDKMECSETSKGFNERYCGTSNPNSHQQIHSGVRPYKCGTCNKAFSHAEHLQWHERIHTGERPYKCGTCNKAFSRATHLQCHERIHTGERPYKCSTCNKAFSQSSYLHTHERFHTGERPYKCTTCNKTFSVPLALHRHERIHTGERPYKCSICNKAFSLSLDLHRHKRIHTGERPYKCTICNEAFSVPSALRRHERIHTGERPYKCGTCNKAFSQPSDLHRHKRIHTGDRPY